MIYPNFQISIIEVFYCDRGADILWLTLTLTDDAHNSDGGLYVVQ